jgi:hypothetical protein
LKATLFVIGLMTLLSISFNWRLLSLLIDNSRFHLVALRYKTPSWLRTWWDHSCSTCSAYKEDLLIR